MYVSHSCNSIIMPHKPFYTTNVPLQLCTKRSGETREVILPTAINNRYLVMVIFEIVKLFSQNSHKKIDQKPALQHHLSSICAWHLKVPSV